MRRADRHREQQQRHERVLGEPVLPQRPVAEQTRAEVAEELAEQGPEHDRPRRTRRQDPGDAGQRRPARGKHPAGGEPEREQHDAVADVSDHDTEHQRQEERHQQRRIEGAGARKVQEADERLERPCRPRVAHEQRRLRIARRGRQVLDEDRGAEAGVQLASSAAPGGAGEPSTRRRTRAASLPAARPPRAARARRRSRCEGRGGERRAGAGAPRARPVRRRWPAGAPPGGAPSPRRPRAARGSRTPRAARPGEPVRGRAGRARRPDGGDGTRPGSRCCRRRRASRPDAGDRPAPRRAAREASRPSARRRC